MIEAEEKERFVVTDESSAEWTMEKLAECEKSRADINAQYEKMVERYTEWRDKQIEEIDNSVSYFEGLLREWAGAKLEGSKKKSISLPSGRVGFRAGTTSYMYGGKKVDKNDADFVNLVKQIAPETIETKESVKWADFKRRLQVTDSGKVVTNDGEIVEGMTGVTAEPTFYTKVSVVE